MNKILRVSIYLIIASFLISCKETKVENLKTFAEAYGYVKYFYPGDEAFKLDWQKFSALGAREVIVCNSRKELLNTLNHLFIPVAQGVKFFYTGDSSTYDITNLIPLDTSGYKITYWPIPHDTSGYRITYWQHQGVSFDMHAPDKRPNAYKSVRVNRTTADTALFPANPEFGRILVKEIGQGISICIPLALYCNDRLVFPVSNPDLIARLKKELSALDYKKEEMYLRLGNVINVFNVIKHFYPYFDVVDVNWKNEFTKALTKTFYDKNAYDHEQTLAQFTAALNDGHAGATYLKTEHYYSLPISWEWVEKKLVITNNYENNPGFNIGDVVSRINGESPEDYFERSYSVISGATKGWLDYKANLISLTGEENSSVRLLINDKTVKLKRTNKFSDYYQRGKISKPAYSMIHDDIIYLDMDQILIDTINKIMPLLEKSKAIICDARGYPKGNHLLITHFLNIDDTTSGWMQIPQIIYPDFENVTWTKHNWISTMKAQKPYLGNKKLIYIIDGSAISYAESCLGYIEGYKLATIIGQPSAGTNGNINPFTLPGDYLVNWTGMKVVKHNGKQHHGIGIKPDIYIEKTIKGIKEGRDEFLEKAIEIALK